jgi:hypothetical protein
MQRAFDMTAPPYQRYGQNIRDRAFNFACDIVHYGGELFQRGGESRPDFISKCSIALKESRERDSRRNRSQCAAAATDI